MFIKVKYHFRVPNPESGLVVHTPMEVFSPTISLQNHRRCFRGSSLASTKNIKLLEPSTSETREVDPLSAARSRVYERSSNKVIWNIMVIVPFGSSAASTTKYYNLDLV